MKNAGIKDDDDAWTWAKWCWWHGCTCVADTKVDCGLSKEWVRLLSEPHLPRYVTGEVCHGLYRPPSGPQLSTAQHTPPGVIYSNGTTCIMILALFKKDLFTSNELSKISSEQKNIKNCYVMHQTRNPINTSFLQPNLKYVNMYVFWMWPIWWNQLICFQWYNSWCIVRWSNQGKSNLTAGDLWA